MKTFKKSSIYILVVGIAVLVLGAASTTVTRFNKISLSGQTNQVGDSGANITFNGLEIAPPYPGDTNQFLNGGRAWSLPAGNTVNLQSTNAVQATDTLPVTTDGGSNTFKITVAGLFGTSPKASVNDAVNNPYNIATWGDSLTTGTGGTPYPTQLNTLLGGVNLVNKGAGGTKASFALTNQFTPNPKLWTFSHIFWESMNDTNVSECLSNIQAMVALIPVPKKFAVLSIIQTQSPDAASYNFYTNMNSVLASTYPTNFLNVDEVLRQGGTNIPLSLRADIIHLNTAGYAIVANYLYTNIAVWSGGARIANAVSTIDLGALLSSPSPIGNVLPNVGSFTGIAISSNTIYPTNLLEIYEPSNTTPYAIKMTTPSLSGGAISKIAYYTGTTLVGSIDNLLNSGAVGDTFDFNVRDNADTTVKRVLRVSALQSDFTSGLTASTNVGIGTTAPWVTLTVKGKYSTPSLLHTDTNGILALNSSILAPGRFELFFGNYINSPFAWWLQTRAGVSDGITTPLVFNPLGGFVGVGNSNPAVALDVTGAIKSSLGFAGSRSNLLAATSITFPATTVNWTNPLPVSIQVYIDNTSVVGTLLKKNGTQIFGAGVMASGATVGLQVGEYFSETYSAGTPTATFSPFP